MMVRGFHSPAANWRRFSGALDDRRWVVACSGGIAGGVCRRGFGKLPEAGGGGGGG